MVKGFSPPAAGHDGLQELGVAVEELPVEELPVENLAAEES